MPTATDRTPLSVEEFQAKASDLVKEVARTQDPIPVAVGGKPVAVLLDLETYHYHIHLINLARALFEAEADIRAGRTRPLDEVMNELLDGTPNSRGRGASRRSPRPAKNS
jgi:prevent-host-death family protein